MESIRKGELAQRVGVSAARVSQWVGAGMPVEPDGLVVVETALAWIAAHVDRSGGGWPTRRATSPAPTAPSPVGAGPIAGPAPQQAPQPAPSQPYPHRVESRLEPAAGIDLPRTLLAARTKKLMAEAKCAERRDRRESGELYPAAEFRPSWESAILNARAKLLALGHRLAPRLAIESDAARCKEIVDEAVRESLTELAASGGQA